MLHAKVLFISGSIGLGHVTRDLAIAAELRRRDPDLEIFWLAGDAAREILNRKGETLLPEAARYTTGSSMLESVSANHTANLANPLYLKKPIRGFRLLRAFKNDLDENLSVFKNVTADRCFDLVIGDETFELVYAMHRNPRLKKCPFVLITDFIGVEAMTRSPLERAIVFLCNRAWAGLLRRVPSLVDRLIFVGEEADVPDSSLGAGPPDRRQAARRVVDFVGYVLPFRPAELSNRSVLRTKLGYGPEPVVSCSVGGTRVGADLLKLFTRAALLVRNSLPTARFIVVAGPRLSAADLEPAPGVEILGFVPNFHEHLAACDLAVVQGGATTTLELTALRRPFLFFPLEQHFEQQVHVAGRLARHGAGIKMRFSSTGAEDLAHAILGNIGAQVSYPTIPADGADIAAEVIGRLLMEHVEDGRSAAQNHEPS